MRGMKWLCGCVVPVVVCFLALHPPDARGAAFGGAQQVPVPQAAGADAFVLTAVPDPSGFLVVTVRNTPSWRMLLPFLRMAADGGATTITTVEEKSSGGYSYMTRTAVSAFGCARDGMLQYQTDYSDSRPIQWGPSFFQNDFFWGDADSSSTILSSTSMAGYGSAFFSVSSGTLDAHGHWMFLRSDVVETSPSRVTQLLNPAHGVSWYFPADFRGAQLMAGLDGALVAIDGFGGKLTETTFSSGGYAQRTVHSFDDAATRTVLACATDARTSVVVYLSPAGRIACLWKGGATVRDVDIDNGAPFAGIDRIPCGFDSSGGFHAFFLTSAHSRILHCSPTGAMQWVDPAASFSVNPPLSWSLDNPNCPQLAGLGADGGVYYLEFNGAIWTSVQVAPPAADVRYTTNLRVGVSRTAGKMVTWEKQRLVNGNWIHDSTWMRTAGGGASAAGSDWALFE